MSVSILLVDDEPDVAELFRQRFRREARQGTYVMHFASSGEDALSKLDDGVDPQLARSDAVPEVGRIRPQSMRRVVVLPAPLAPRKPKTSPRGTLKLTPSTARRGP